VWSAVVLVSWAGALTGCGNAPDQGVAPPLTATSATAERSVGAPPAATSSPQQHATTAPPTGQPPIAQGPTLAPRTKELIEAAKRARQESVVLTISVVPGQTDTIAQALRDLGATVESTDPTVGYIRAGVPTAVAAQAATLAGVSRADVEEPIGVPDPTP
jgi:hypothetical protein